MEVIAPVSTLLNKVLWCNWLARRTLNPAIRVQVPAEPFGVKFRLARIARKSDASGEAGGFDSLTHLIVVVCVKYSLL